LFTSSFDSVIFTFVHPDNTVICQVRTSRAAIKEEADVEETATEETATEAAE
jgi:large subunit ribosomal protein L25